MTLREFELWLAGEYERRAEILRKEDSPKQRGKDTKQYIIGGMTLHLYIDIYKLMMQVDDIPFS